MKINPNFNRLPGNYLFNHIAEKVSAFKEDNPDSKIIKLSIGDVTQPLPRGVVEAMTQASQEQLNSEVQ